MAKILVIDDDSDIRGSICELLGLFDYELSEAGDGIEGLEVALRVRPDLILCDVVMPGLTGFQVTRSLTKNPDTANIPVILCTGKSQATDLAWALKMGAKACVTKPVVGSELLALIKTLE